MMRKPLQIKRATKEIAQQKAGTGLDIRWDSGDTAHLDSRTLRENCPCATCQEKRGDTSHSTPLTKSASKLTVLRASVEEELNLTQVFPVGNYAVSLHWGDGHNSGIYTFAFLDELSQETQKAS